MKKPMKAMVLILVLVLALGSTPNVLATAPEPETFGIVEARLVTEVLDWGETITAVRIEYDDKIWCGDIEYSIESADRMTYKMVTNRDIVNLYVNDSGKKDDIQLKGKYVFINLGIECEDVTTYVDQIVFQDGRRTRQQPTAYFVTQSLPITSVNGKVAPPRTFSTAGSAMTAAKTAALPALSNTVLGDDVTEVRTASTEVRVVIDDFRTFDYTNPITGTRLRFHLYIPPGYAVDRESEEAEDLDALPMIVHFANNGDMSYVDDTHVPDSEKRYLGALFTHPEAIYWATEEAQERHPAFVLSLAGSAAGSYGGDYPANWGNWYERSQMQQDFMAAARWVKDTFKVDVDRVGAINLAGSLPAMFGTLLSDDVDDFSACVVTAYDPYHVFVSNANLSTPIGGTAETTFEGKMHYAEEQYAKLMEKMASWQFAGLNDRSGTPISGDNTAYAAYDSVYSGRYKGERLLDFAYRMNKAAGETVVVANNWDSMWNGLINMTPSSNQNIKGSESEIRAQAQWDEAEEVGAKHLVTVFMPGTILQTMHWSWNAANSNLVVQDWMFAQNRDTYEGPDIDLDTLEPKDYSAPDYEQNPRTPRDVPADAGSSARVVEARLVTEVLDWGETITAVRIEYSEEVLCDAVEYSVEHANRQTYQMVSNRDIVNLYVNNSGKKDDYQPQGKYVFINLGLDNWDVTSYRDQIVFYESQRIRPRPDPYYIYQAYPVVTLNNNVIQPRSITTATGAIRGELMDTSELPNIEQMDVWSTEVRMNIDDFRTFRYTNPMDKSVTKFHLYIPEGYEKYSEDLEDIPIIVHFPAGDTRFVDDVLGDADASRQMGALFTHPDAAVWGSKEAQAQQKAFVITPGPDWNDNYMFIVKELVENLNIDISKIYAISLAGGTPAMWNTILANPGVFAAQINTSYDPYHAFASSSLGDNETRAKYAEDKFEQLLNELPGWFFAGLTDRTGSGSPVNANETSLAKGERWHYIGDLMKEKGYNIDIGWGDEGELMWNGMLRGRKAEAAAMAQLDRAKDTESEHLITLFIPGTILQSMHWSWIATYSNAVVRGWLYAQTNPDPVGTANIVSPEPVYIVTFDPNNGEVETTYEVTGTDGKLTSWPTATRSGYSFDGWFTAATGGIRIPSDYVFDADTTVYAHWGSTGSGSTGGSGIIPGGGSGSGSTGGSGSTDTTGQDSQQSSWFQDVNAGDWFYNNVSYVYQNNLMNGTSTSPMLFDPNGTLTRGMIVTILYRQAGSPNVGGLENPFSDVPGGQWYTDAVIWAADNNVVEGFGDGLYGPEMNVTREQLAAILYRYAQFLGKVPEGSLDGALSFADAASIADYAKDAALFCSNNGIITGKLGNLFDPQGNATRAEAAAMLNRFIESILMTGADETVDATLSEDEDEGVSGDEGDEGDAGDSGDEGDEGGEEQPEE